MTLTLIFSIAILIMSVVIHEVSHGYAAYMLGDPTAHYEGRLTLNPLKHLDPIGSIILPILTYLGGGFIFGWAKPVPYNPYNLKGGARDEALVAFAGPVSNMLIAAIFGLILRFGSTSLPFSALEILSMIVLINIVLSLFNLIPIPPLDGSKILFSLLPARLQYIRASLERYSLIAIFVVVFFVWPAVSPLISTIFSSITGISI